MISSVNIIRVIDFTERSSPVAFTFLFFVFCLSTIWIMEMLIFLGYLTLFIDIYKKYIVICSYILSCIYLYIVMLHQQMENKGLFV